MPKQRTDIYEVQADLCKVFTSAIRIKILNLLKDSEKTVTELVKLLNLPKANVSQHLALMRHKGLLKSRREGTNIYYSITNPKIVQACSMMREVLSDIIKARDGIHRTI